MSAVGTDKKIGISTYKVCALSCDIIFVAILCSTLYYNGLC